LNLQIYKSTVNAKAKGQAHAVKLILIECLNEKKLHFAINVPKIPPSNPVHFASRVRRLRAIRLVWYSLSLVQVAASKTQGGSSSCASTIFCKRSKPQTGI